MARRDSYPGGKWYKRPGEAYARTSGWPTRYYQRKIGGSMVTALAGINTTSDDFSKKEGESPYLWNARLSGTREARKRAQSMSRMGQEFYTMPEGAEIERLYEQGDVRVEVSEKRSVRWTVGYYDWYKITSVGLSFAFDEDPGDTNAHFVLILRDRNQKEVCRAIRKVTELYKREGEVEWFRFIRTLPAGEINLEASIVDDLDNNGRALGNSIYLRATGARNHEYAYHNLPNLDKALREEPYEWHKGINYPTTQVKMTNWKTFPVWLQRGFFNAGGSRYAVMGVVDGEGKKSVWCAEYATINTDTGEHINWDAPKMKVLIPSSQIDQRCSQVRMTQAGNCLYFVDGYSPLQKVDLDTWEVKESIPDINDIDTFGFAGDMYYYANAIIIANGSFQRCKVDFQAGDTFNQDDWEPVSVDSLKAWPGASLIYFLNNRLFLSGYRHETVGEGEKKAEPNLVNMSSIDSVKPQYDMWNKSIEFFYVPDMAPSQSSAAPVTAFASLGDYLLIFTTDGLVIETVQSAVEFSGISQSVPEGSQFGVMKQEHVAIGRNNIYFFNPVAGIMRTAGSTATQLSGPIDSLMEGLDEEAKANAHLTLTNDVLRFYYSPDGTENTQSFVDYVNVSAHRSYWYRDQNTPVKSTCIDQSSDMLVAIHSEYPCMMLLDSTLKDFDCAILYEYYTKYIGTPDRLDHVIVRRVHITTLQTFQSSVYVGLDYDHNNKPIVWRKFIQPTEPGTFAPEDIFGDDEESGATNLDIRILTDDTRFVQIRLKQYCYDFQAEILQVGFEYANRTTL